MVQICFIALAFIGLLSYVAAECPNACSAHGKCGAYDMCICYRNWMANDCSERICQFGMAHVDSPKGDLDASSGALSGPSVNVIPNDAVYPYGTTEQYPAMVDSESNVLSNTAHAYMECSNKGLCDRTAGICGCFTGYDGSACQRASCPSSSAGDCSGHGTCESIKQISASDNYNVYNLWDQNLSMGCVCDSGYDGSDCSMRTCKLGADPLYHDDYANVRYSNFTYQIYTTSSTNTIVGNYSIVFKDSSMKTWETGAIDVDATCAVVIQALESLPNNVIPSGSVRCLENDNVLLTGGQNPTTENIYDVANMFIKSKFTLAFTANVGKLDQLDLNLNLDGARPTLYSPEDTDIVGSTVGYAVYPNGYAGEVTDYVNDFCEGVQVSVTTSTSTSFFHTLTFSTNSVSQIKLLKTCLGDSDGNAADNVEVYNWDYGANALGSVNFLNPHLIKLIDATQDQADPGDEVFVPGFFEDPSKRPYPQTRLCNKNSASPCSNINPPGFYAVIFYDGTNFNIFNRIANDYGPTTLFHVYTTTGYLQLVNENAVAVTINGEMNTGTEISKSYYSNTVYTTTAGISSSGDSFVGQVDCLTNPVGTNGALDCLKKGDLVMLLNTAVSTYTNVISASNIANNPVYLDMYTVEKISVEPYNSASRVEDERHPIVLDYGVNALYYKYNLATGGAYWPTHGSQGGAGIYKFHPPTGYNYVGECSNRGLCDTVLGVCSCFAGYTSDNCGVQNALAL